MSALDRPPEKPGVAAGAAMAERLSLCNEVLEPWGFAEQCAHARQLGYRALEVAPYTLAEDPSTITDAQAAQWAAIARDHDIAISGLHWLLVAPAGLSISNPDATVQRRTAALIERLIDLCARLGGRYLVHGSPAQRDPLPGQSPQDALARATDAWVAAGQYAQAAGVTYCIEPLGRAQTRVVNTVAEAAAIVSAAGLPGLRTMLDTSSAGATEAEPLPDLIDRWWPSGLLAHVQLNDRNRQAPGQGDDRFGPILAALARHGYDGWLAVEPFDYRPDGPGCAAFAAGYLRGLLEPGRAG
ncbi:MAG: sugar phosphate isomerase/epimerase family protein [Lautropia sp.]